MQGAALNAAEETAFHAFVEGGIGFLDMAEIVETVMDRMHDGRSANSIEDVFSADGEARTHARELIASKEKAA
ncbi:hypothetical protein BK661_30425 [Pseudomonas frederiksbergensis]|uniref:DXP reductoisomerase C-terminal domain-containing protein n=1 Tax=Pseudomonas frederiksbergensis TaxID=104087 RepID=A0A423HCG9_9PSED|nr:hypothetical protein BK661_30425 [Pseudomonas frederiksbergensis]